QEKNLEQSTESGADKADQPARKEADAGMTTLVDKVKQERELLKAGGTSGITGKFGKPAFSDSDDSPRPKEGAKGKDAATMTETADKAVADKDAPGRPHGSTRDVATHMRTRAEFELQNIHRGAKYTINGSAPTVVAYDDSYKLKTPLTLDE